jgi:uncharacterized protein (DUF433 family)
MTTATQHRYIVFDDQILGGEPVIKGSRTPVRAIVELWRLGVLPEEMPEHLPHLTLALVFDALSYYSEHQDEINEYIERNRVPDEMTKSITAPSSPSVERLTRSFNGC